MMRRNRLVVVPLQYVCQIVYVRKDYRALFWLPDLENDARKEAVSCGAFKKRVTAVTGAQKNLFRTTKNLTSGY